MHQIMPFFLTVLVTIVVCVVVALWISWDPVSNTKVISNKIKYIEAQKKIIEESLSNYRQERILDIKRDIQEEERKCWVNVQHERKMSYDEIASIKIGIEKERNVLNILKSEKISLEALITQKDNEIKMLSDLLKSAISKKE